MDGSSSHSQRFRLNENGISNPDGKLFIFVKLTDSCMKTFETYLKQNRKSSKSVIKFNSNGGDISIPMNNGEKRIYSFQISPENKTPEVFESIKQINRDQIESCGLIEQRLNIHAKEDVYSMTKSKVTEYQKIEDSTKKTTKEIGESSKTILEKKTNKHHGHNRLSTPTASTNAKPRPSTTTTTTSESHLSPTNVQSNTAAERSLRERLVHLLAAKTYKKPELLVRLKFDGGIRDDEKEQLDSLLTSISTQTKTGEYILSKQILTSGEVSYEWPFYPKAEALTVRKKIKDLQANANRPTVTKPTNDTRPTSSKTDQSNTNNRLKKSDRISELDNPLNDQRMQQLSDMLDKMNHTLSQCNKSSQELRNEVENINENDLDEVEREYNRLAPEYNRLIEYLNSISRKFTLLQQQFNDEQNQEKAQKIVDEFLQCENDDGFLSKRQRVVQLHSKLEHYRQLLQSTSPLTNDLQFSEDDDD